MTSLSSTEVLPMPSRPMHLLRSRRAATRSCSNPLAPPLLFLPDSHSPLIYTLPQRGSALLPSHSQTSSTLLVVPYGLHES